MSGETFAIWSAKREIELAQMLAMCHTILSDDPNVLSEQIRKAESWLCYFQLLLPTADAMLRIEESHLVDALLKMADLKAYDREVKIKAGASAHRELRDKLENLIDSLKTRISLGQTLLKVMPERIVDRTRNN